MFLKLQIVPLIRTYKVKVFEDYIPKHEAEKPHSCTVTTAHQTKTIPQICDTSTFPNQIMLLCMFMYSRPLSYMT